MTVSHEPEYSRALLERARAIAAPFREQAGVIGAFVFGSATRPYADAHSHVDVQIVVEAGAGHDVSQVREPAGDKRSSELWKIDIEDLARRLEQNADMHRYRVAHADVLYDTSDRIAALVARAAHVRPDVREARMRVHHYDFAKATQALLKAEKRERRPTAMLFAAELVVAAGNLLLLARHQWPPPLHWLFEELAAAGTPPEIVAGLRELAVAPSARSARRLRGQIDAYLLANGITFVRDPEALWASINNTEKGQLAHVTYGSELSRRA